MKPLLRVSLTLALIQTGVLVVGILGVAASNRVASELGYPDLRDFLFFMNHGWLLLPVPVVWMAVAGRFAVARNLRSANATAVFLSGAALIVMLMGALALDVIEPWRATRIDSTERDELVVGEVR
jgi:hypothetical protein